MIPAAQVTEMRRFNNQVLGSIPPSMRTLERRLSGAPPVAIRDGLLELVPGIADQYGRVMAEGTAEWYERARLSVVGGAFTARTGDLPDPDVVRRNVRWAAGALFVESRVSPFQTLVGSLERHVMDVGRTTVALNSRADPRASGWRRMAQADACGFCQLLSGRVYGGDHADFSAHDHCRCVAVPEWGR